MRTAVFADPDWGDDYLRFLKQYGVDDVVLGYRTNPHFKAKFSLEAGQTHRNSHWDFEELVEVREHCRKFGLRVASIENPHPGWCYDRVKMGLPGRDQEIEDLVITIRNMGKAGITMLGYNWMVNEPGKSRFSWRTGTTLGRGGAEADVFNMEVAKKEPLFRDRVDTHEDMWANYEYFVKAIVPALEEAGVSMALHPDDPPVESLGGMPRLFYNPEGFQRAMEIANSPVSGLNLCLGNWTAMKTDIPAAIRHFGARGQIFYGHVQGVQGGATNFVECFPDEADCDFLEIIQTLDEVGVDSFLIPAHFPRTTGDTKQQHHALAHAIGYLSGLYHAVGKRGK